jgi:hypothetical protein
MAELPKIVCDRDSITLTYMEINVQVRNRMTAFKSGTVPSKRVNRTATRVKRNAGSDYNSMRSGTEDEVEKNTEQLGSNNASRSGSPSLATSHLPYQSHGLSNVGTSGLNRNAGPSETPDLDLDSDSSFEPELSVREARAQRQNQRKRERQEALRRISREAVREAVTAADAGLETAPIAGNAIDVGDIETGQNNAGSSIAPNARRSGRINSNRGQ